MSAKCYSGRIFSKNLSAKYRSIKKQHQRRYFHIPPGAVYILFQLILIILLFLFIPIFPYEFITNMNANTKQKHNCKIVKSIQSPHISLFFIIRMDKKIETAYITTIAKTASKTRSIGEDSTTEIIDFPMAGILDRRSKVTQKPATGIYINTRPLIEPYL